MQEAIVRTRRVKGGSVRGFARAHIRFDSVGVQAERVAVRRGRADKPRLPPSARDAALRSMSLACPVMFEAL